MMVLILPKMNSRGAVILKKRQIISSSKFSKDDSSTDSTLEWINKHLNAFFIIFPLTTQRNKLKLSQDGSWSWLKTVLCTFSYTVHHQEGAISTMNCYHTQPWETRGKPLRMCQFDMLARPTFLVRTLINNHLICFPKMWATLAHQTDTCVVVSPCFPGEIQ